MYNCRYETKKQRKQCKNMTWYMAMKKNKDANTIISCYLVNMLMKTLGWDLPKPMYLKTRRIDGAF